MKCYHDNHKLGKISLSLYWLKFLNITTVTRNLEKFLCGFHLVWSENDKRWYYHVNNLAKFKCECNFRLMGEKKAIRIKNLNLKPILKSRVICDNEELWIFHVDSTLHWSENCWICYEDNQEFEKKKMWIPILTDTRIMI